MKLERDRPSKTISYLYKFLLTCFVALVFLLIVGTLYGVFFHVPSSKNEKIEVLRNDNKGQTFAGIGQIRVPTADPQPAMVILLVSLVYFPDDKAFSEELVFRIGDFRNIIESYVSALSILELQKLGDEGIKMELLHRFNSILRLGQIETLYLNDFMIIE